MHAAPPAACGHCISNTKKSSNPFLSHQGFEINSLFAFCPSHFSLSRRGLVCIPFLSLLAAAHNDGARHTNGSMMRRTASRWPHPALPHGAMRAKGASSGGGGGFALPFASILLLFFTHAGCIDGLSITCPSPDRNSTTLLDNGIGSHWGTVPSPYAGQPPLPAIEVPMVYGTAAAQVTCCRRSPWLDAASISPAEWVGGTSHTALP